MRKYNTICTSDLITMTKEDKDGIHEEQITDKEYNNIISWIPLLRAVGGSETVRYEYYSKYGYKIVRYIKSISPDGTQNVIYRFKI